MSLKIYIQISTFLHLVKKDWDLQTQHKKRQNKTALILKKGMIQFSDIHSGIQDTTTSTKDQTFCNTCQMPTAIR